MTNCDISLSHKSEGDAQGHKIGSFEQSEEKQKEDNKAIPTGICSGDKALLVLHTVVYSGCSKYAV